VRREEGVFVIEGARLVRAALDARADVEGGYVAAVAWASTAGAGDLVALASDAGVRVHELAPGVLERITDTVTPQPVLAVVRTPQASLASLDRPTFVVVCVDVRDPGNAGAIVRVADAAGADAVVCCDGTVDPFNPKAVRASAGSVLHLPVVAGGDPAAVLGALGSLGLQRVAASVRGGRVYTDIEWAEPVALVFGNEGSGLAEGTAAHVDAEVTIPMAGGAESLNVAMAAAVLCFEARRLRSNMHDMRGPA
jgi:RNA methyltransferase, TrmH family